MKQLLAIFRGVRCYHPAQYFPISNFQFRISLISFISLIPFLTASAFAQSPEKMSYQAVVRDASDNLVTNQLVGMQISILQGSTGGTAVYVETQTPTTNTNGLITIEIGTGAVVSGDFSTIYWSNDTYFIKTETDPTGGTTYTITGTSQLLSVPYALHAKTADSITGTITETDPVFGSSVANSITAADTVNWSNHTIDTDTQLDSSGIAALGYAAGAHTVDTQIDSAGIAALGFVTTGTTQIDSIGIANLGYAAGAHTTDTQLDSTAIATMGFITSAGSGSSDNFYLGKDTLGGIVYYIYKDATGTQHGLIVNKYESTAVWQATGTSTGADRTEDGAYNTALMTNSAAATYVNGLTDSGFSDWYLPSIYELGLLYHNGFTTNKALRTGSFTLLSSTAFYWSSTEYSTTVAFYFRFYVGSASSNSYKDGTLSVRAVRAF